jgi:hypothetical protein
MTITQVSDVERDLRAEINELKVAQQPLSDELIEMILDHIEDNPEHVDQWDMTDFAKWVMAAVGIGEPWRVKSIRDYFDRRSAKSAEEQP